METETVKVLVNGRRVEILKGAKLSQALKKAGGLKMPCAGNGICGKCRVTAKGQLSPPDETERELLTEAERKQNIRLACRAKALGDCSIFFPREEIRQGKETLQEKTEAGKPLFTKLGAAIDIGTTTMAAALYGEDGLLARTGCDNPQAVFGADVISRIEKSMAGEGAALAEAVRTGIAALLETLSQKSGRKAEEIDTLVICGNTAMLYLLTEKDPKPLSCAPFQADWLAGEWQTGRQLKLPCAHAKVYLPPCISAFVGADITMAMLQAVRDGEKDNRMLADIGTNGEIVLWKKEAILCCSTAAGPAFEGAGLKMGMPGIEGAVSHVTAEKNGLRAEVIGDRAPAGICGSGVIDAVRCLLQTGQMDETGYLEEEAVIAGEVRLFQADIRKVQLAKSAICAGILSMLHRADMALTELEELLVAGGFGSFIRLENAVAIGLLPPIETEKITVCGNAALAGAVMVLLDAALCGRAGELADRAQTVNLAADEYFKNCYMEGMLFGAEKL